MAVQEVAQQAVDHTPAWLAFTGAMLVALIAAVTADLRQRRQLAHEARRHREQLAHDRELRDLEELRALLDEVTAAVNAMRSAFESMASALKTTTQFASASRPYVGVDEKLHSFRERIVLRLGAGHPIDEALNSLRAVVAQFKYQIEHHQGQPDEPARLQYIEDAKDAVRAQQMAFFAACHAVIGVRIATAVPPPRED